MILKNKLSGLLIALALASCGMIGGPSDADLLAAAKQQMLEDSLPTAQGDEASKQAIQTAVNASKFEKKGICNVQKEVHNCGGEITFTPPGSAEMKQLVMISVKKTDKGWVSAD